MRLWHGMVLAFGVALAVLGGTVGRRQWRLADVGNRNINKQTCSCVFVGGQTLDACIADIPPPERMHMNFVRFVLESTPGRERLTNTMFWLIKSTAVYEPGTGCTQY